MLTGGSNSGPLLTDLSNFPNGPHTHTDVGGRSPTLNPVATGSSPGSPIAFEQPHGGAHNFLFGTIGQTTCGVGGIAGEFNAHPTIASPGGIETIVFDFAAITNGTVGNGRLIACNPAHPISAGCPKTPLPGVPCSGGDYTRLAFTPSGRYMGFIGARSAGSTSDGFIGVWDSGTQEVVSLTALDSPPPDSGYLSLYERPLFKLASIDPSGVVRFNLLSGSSVGILVQRVTGHRKLFSRRAPRLGKARRVPLGSFHRGLGTPTGTSRWAATSCVPAPIRSPFGP